MHFPKTPKHIVCYLEMMHDAISVDKLSVGTLVTGQILTVIAVTCMKIICTVAMVGLDQCTRLRRSQLMLIKIPTSIVTLMLDKHVVHVEEGVLEVHAQQQQAH